MGHGAGTGTGQGFGSGHGRLGGSHASAAPRVRMGAVNVTGRLPPEVIQRIVRQNFGRFRLCYEQGLTQNPNLEGRVTTRFTINASGEVAGAQNGGSDIPDASVVSCVVNAMSGLSFPQPEGGSVVVAYPIMFSPGDSEARPTSSVTVKVDGLPRIALGCSRAAQVPLFERIALWRERLARVSGNPGGVANVYRDALRDCEAPTWRERRRLLSLLLDALPSVTQRVQLWRIMFDDKSAADVLYRGLVARVKKAAEMRELHQALGLKAMDPGLLAKYIKDAKTPGARVDKLRALWSEWPDDFAVALALMDALEDADDRGVPETSPNVCARGRTSTPTCARPSASCISGSPPATRTRATRPRTPARRGAPSARSWSSLRTTRSRGGASVTCSAPMAGTPRRNASIKRWRSSHRKIPPCSSCWARPRKGRVS